MIHGGHKTRFREEHAEQPMKKSRKDTKGIVVDAYFSSKREYRRTSLAVPERVCIRDIPPSH
jgi:hypothetical protein